MPKQRRLAVGVTALTAAIARLAVDIFGDSRKRFDQENQEWALKQKAAAPGRYYGNGGTIHRTSYLDVETYKGQVVSVWFRCQMLPFRQTEVDKPRAEEMTRAAEFTPSLTGVEVFDG